LKLSTVVTTTFSKLKIFNYLTKVDFDDGEHYDRAYILMAFL